MAISAARVYDSVCGRWVRPSQAQRHLTKWVVWPRTDNCWRSTWIRHVTFRHVSPVTGRMSPYYVSSSRTEQKLSSPCVVPRTPHSPILLYCLAVMRRSGSECWVVAWDVMDTSVVCESCKQVRMLLCVLVTDNNLFVRVVFTLWILLTK